MKVELVSIDSITIQRDSRQRRKLEGLEELSDSLRRIGQINPITITRDRVLVTGERRITAAKLLGWTHIHANILEDLDEVARQIVELEENINRVDITWQDQVDSVERIFLLKREKDPAITQERLAKDLGFTSVYVSYLLSLAAAMKLEKFKYLRDMSNWKSAYAALKRAEERSAALELELLNLSSAPAPTSVAELMEEKPSAALKEVPTGAFSILPADFHTWAREYSGERFNLLHCDFPYGISHHKSDQGASAEFKPYEDSPEVYWELCKTLCSNAPRLLAHSAHIIFWLSLNNLPDTLAFFREHLPNVAWNPFPLIWHKSDNTGILPDPKRGPRRVYETALFGSQGDRLIVKPISNLKAVPAYKAQALHLSEKPLEVLRYFFEMFVDSSTRLLDPTCGSGSSIRAALWSGANCAVGLEIDHENAAQASAALEKDKLLCKECGLFSQVELPL